MPPSSDYELSSSDYSTCSSSDDEGDIELNVNDPKFFLLKWAVRHNITHTALNGLFPILRLYGPDFRVPLDAKTFFGIKKENRQIVRVGNGKLYYIGVRTNVLKHFESGLKFCPLPDLPPFQSLVPDRTLTITVGIDGLPLTRSGRKCYWPIVGKLDQSSNQSPFLRGLYYGEEKPPLEAFLNDFVTECLSLESDVIVIDDKLYQFRIRCIVADAPARSFLKGSASYNGYYGCERCGQKGVYRHIRVLFPNTDSCRRSDLEFKQPVPSHPTHIIKKSPLSQLNLGLVSQFVLDYMHLNCLGVVLKLIRTWVRGDLPHRLNSSITDRISKRLISYNEHLPLEFCRKGRSLLEIDHSKATELRMFLLCTGPIALKNLLPRKKYKHFLLFSVATYILLNHNICSQWIEVAKKMLIEFNASIPLLHEEHFLVYNFHSVIHLSEDVTNFGSLNTCNAFPFENFMQVIKKMLRAKNRFLEQVINRIHEYELVNEELYISSQKHLVGVTSSRGNNVILSKSGDFFLVEDATTHMHAVKKFIDTSSCSKYPIDSSLLSVKLVSNISVVSTVLDRSIIMSKCVCLPNDVECTYFCIPLVHSVVE